MSLSQAFILNRTQKTTAVYTAIAADWTWEELTAPEYFARKSDTEALLDEVSAADFAALAKRGILDEKLDALKVMTMQVTTMARGKWRNDPDKKNILAKLSSNGVSRVAQRAEATAMVTAWPLLDAAWVPLPLLTLAAYTTARAEIEGNDVATPKVKGAVDHYEEAYEVWRKKAEEFNARLAADEDLNVTWYSAATVVFPEGTANGDMIRGQIPTTHDPDNEPLPIPGKPTGLTAGPGAIPGEVIVIWLPGTYANEYQITLLIPGGSPDQLTANTSDNQYTFTGLPTGTEVTATLVAINATGVSEPSDEVSVVVP